MGQVVLNSPKGRGKVALDFLRGDALPQLIKDLNNGVLDKLEVVRTKNHPEHREMVMLSKAEYDNLLAAYAGPALTTHLMEKTDDFCIPNLMELADLLLGRRQTKGASGGVRSVQVEGTNGNDYLVVFVKNTSNSGVVSAVLLNPDYYDLIK